MMDVDELVVAAEIQRRETLGKNFQIIIESNSEENDYNVNNRI
jgi:hypothetical protein